MRADKTGEEDREEDMNSCDIKEIVVTSGSSISIHEIVIEQQFDFI